MKKTKILIVNSAQDKTNLHYAQSVRMLLQRSNPHIEHHKNIRSAKDIAAYDAVIISGQPPSDISHTATSVARNYPWIKDIDVPLIGICGGHQVIALSFGARIIEAKEAEPKGFYTAYTKDRLVKHPIFAGIFFEQDNSFIVYNKHRDSVELPDSFEILASTDFCKIAMMKHRKKPIYGTQFHPENSDYFRGDEELKQKPNHDSGAILVNFESLVIESAHSRYWV